MNNSALNSENISFAEADFITLIKDVLESLLINIHELSLEMSLVLGAGVVLVGGLLMLLFASHNTGGSSHPLFESLEDKANDAVDKIKKEKEAEQSEKEQFEKKQELEKEQERIEKEREKDKEKLDWKQKEEEKEKEREKEKKEKDDSEREKEGVSKSGEAGLLGKKNTAERLAEANEIFRKIIEALFIGKTDNDITHLFNELSKTGQENEFSATLEATKLFLKENPPKDKQNLNLKTIANWFEKEAEIIERTANHMKEGPKKTDTLEKASDLYTHAGEIHLLQKSTKSILNFEKAVNLAPDKNEKLARYGDACITFERFEKTEQISDNLLKNIKQDLNRKNVSSCLVFCDKMYEANLEKQASILKNKLKEILKENGILIPNQNKQNHSRILSLVKENQKEKEEKQA